MTAPIQQLLDIMAQLRNPQGGCPWDLEQTYQTMIPCVLEESYEVVEALKTEDFSALQEELGDLLLQVVFLSQLAKEDQHFDFNTVVATLSNKLIHRHPHVFGDKSANSAAEALTNWESKKQQERLNKQQTSLLDDVPHALPALLRSEKLQKRAKKLGYQPTTVAQTIAQAEQQLAAIKSAVAANQDHAAKPLAELLFSVSNLCRQLGLQAESLLRDENSRFEQTARAFESYSSNKHFK